jgi:small-conductance mechanosensitive channel
MPQGMNQATPFGATYAELGTALAVAVFAFVAMMLALRIVRTRLERLALRTETQVDNAIADVLAGTRGGLIALASLLIGAGVLEWPPRWEARLHQAWFVVLTLQMALWVNRLVGIVLRRHLERHVSPVAAQGSAAATLTAWGVRTLLWTIVLLAVLGNVGVNITAFVASLGVGGIAVALAAQTILGDLFASLSIAIDKPFEVGDFIVCGSIAGSVENIGVKTTRIRSLGGEQIVISNTELLKQTISNYKRLQRRRIVFGFGVPHETPPELAAQIPQIVREVVIASERLRFDRAHLKAFGPSSLDYEVVYFVEDPDFNLYMDEQQRINLGLMRAFGDRGIGLARPTSTVHMLAPPIPPPDGAGDGAAQGPRPATPDASH